MRGVLKVVAEEAEAVEELILGQLVVVLEHVGEETLSVVLDDILSLGLENFNELAGKLHNLGSNGGDLGEIVLDLFDIFLVHLEVLLVVGDDLLGSLAEGSYELQRLLDEGTESIDLGASHELSFPLVVGVQRPEAAGQRLDEKFDTLFIVSLKLLGELLVEHRERLLEKVDVMGLTNGNEEVLKSSVGELLDVLGVLVDHM